MDQKKNASKPSMDHLLTLVSCGFIGAFIGYSGFILFDHHAHRQLYLARSTPWYTPIIVTGAFTAFLVILCITLKWWIKKNRRMH